MKTGKKLLSIVLAILMVFSAFSISLVFWSSAESEGKKITDYSKGDIIEFGWYPQSRVTEYDTVNALTYAGGSWLSYNYYSGTGSWLDGKMTSSNYMRYKDVIYNGNKYRGVVFDSYRPFDTGYTSYRSRQDNNGYDINTVYWFKYEPIQWRVLDPSTGLVICETIIDSQAYNNYVLESGTDEYENIACWGAANKTYYANNYEKSSIREWLNNNFYNTAFYYSQKDIIQYTKLDNKAYSTSYSAYDSATTNDKIFLLSYAEALNINYFSSSTDLKVKGSDYAKCQGLDVIKEYSHWFLRSAGKYSGCVCRVENVGSVDDNVTVGSTDGGVRPALKFNLKSNIIQIPIHNHRYMGNFEYPSCTEQGYTLCTCEVCGDAYKDNYIDALGHTDTNKDGICDTCKTVFDEALNNKYLVSKATINAPSGKTVDYRNKVKLTATATNVPSGYYVQIFEGNNPVGEKGAANATYTSGELKASTTYTIKIVDAKGNVFSSDAQNKTVKVDVNAGFFKKLVAFFKGLFGTLPTISL